MHLSETLRALAKELPCVRGNMQILNLRHAEDTMCAIFLQQAALGMLDL